jgi:hypothetical protein
MRKYSDGSYESEENILHLWYVQPVYLNSEAIIDEFFDETEREWIRTCPTRPWLLVNYAHVHLRPDMAETYARSIVRFRRFILGTFRYGIEPDALGHFTAVAVRLGNLKLAAPSNIFASEAAARDAIRTAKAAGEGASSH